jgi:hypothetical protein
MKTQNQFDVMTIAHRALNVCNALAHRAAYR